MKKLLIVGLVFFSLSAGAQKTTPKKTIGTSATKPFKNATDSLSYALGVSVASFYKQQGIKDLNITVLSKAMNEVLSGKKLTLTENQCQSIIMSHMQKADEVRMKAEEEKAKPNVEAGQKFLEQNKSNPNVKQTGTGLQYEVITQGTGPKPLASETVVVNYRGSLLNGTEFDNSYSRGEPISFALNQVIAGWTEGLQLMPVGSKYKFYIPHHLGYGMVTKGPIPAGSTLIFEVELLSIKK